MPDIDFPVNPSLNATYSKDGKTWIWDGSRWRTNNILSYSGGGTGYAYYTTGDLLVGTGNSILKFPVGQNNFQYLRVDYVKSASGFTWISLPLAGVGQSGLVSNLNQTFEGVKTFSSSIIGNLTGTATTSENVNVTTTTTSLTHYLTFTNQSSGSGLALTTSAIGIGFTVNPAQNTLAAGTFVGNLSGTAVTAGILKVTSTSGTALNIADRVTVYTVDNLEGLNINSNYSYALSVQDKSNNNRFIVDVSNSRTIFTGNSADHELRIYNSNQSAYAGFKANSTGTVTYILPPGKPSTGTSVLQSDDSGNMIWVPMTTGLSSAITSINSQAGPSITLQTGNTGSDFTISATTNTINFNIPDASGSNRGLVTTGTQTFAGTKTFSSTISGNISGTATTAQNVNTVTSNTAGDHYLVFSPYNGGSGVALSVDGSLTFVPTTNVLTTDVFNGNLSATGATISTILNAQGNVVLGDATNDTLTINARIGSHINPSTNNSYDLGTPALRYRNGFVNNLTGTAFTATDFYGNLTGTIQTASQTNITALGTITTGTWNATAISTAKGGTGQDFSSASGLIKLASGTASNIANPTAASIGVSYLTADTNGNIHWKDNTQVYNGLQYDIAYYNRTGQGVTGTNGVLTFYDVENTKAITVTSNYSGAFTVRDTSNNNRFIVDVSNNKTYFSGNTADHELRIYNSNQSSYTGFKANSTGTVTYILPPGKPSTGSSILQSDDSGNMIWVPMTTGGLANAVTSINSQSGPSITLQTGSSGNNFAISQSANIITFDIPDASGSNRGLVTTGSQTFAGTKTFSSTISGNLSGSATTAQNVNTVSSDTDGDHYLVFSPANGGSGVALSSDSSLKYIPTTNILISDVFSGNLSATGATITTIFNAQGNVVLGDNTGDNVTFNSRVASSINPSSNGSYDLGTPALKYRNGFVNNLTGTAITSTNFYGTLVGNSSTATTAQNLNITKTTLNSIHYLTFSNASVGSGLALTTSEVGVGFTVNPALNTLSAGTFVGNISGTGATFARATFSNDTEATDTTTGSVTFSGGIAVAKKVFSQSVETSGNAIIQGNLQVYGGIIQLGNSATADTVGFISKIQSSFLPQANNTFDIGSNDAVNAWRNAAFAGHGTFANLYGSTSANLTGVQFSGGDILIRSGKSIKIYETGDVYNTSIKSNASISTNYTYTLPVATPGSGGSILQSDTSGNMLWVKAASNKATYVLSFGAGFTPTTGLDSVSLAIPYANDGSTSLTYTIKRVEVRTETEPGASTLAFYFERHTTGNAVWTVTPITIKGAASANFSVAQNNYVSSFTTITSSSGNNGEVVSGNYLRVNFASVGTAANVSISIMIQEN